MDIVNSDEMAWSGQVERHRTGALNFKTLFIGHEGDPENYRMVLSRANGDYASPHHRHNFDQIRFCLEGVANIGPDRDLLAGDVGYFPEGTHYGPQNDPAGARVALVLQFGGASGLGYMSAAQLKAGQQALEARGRFAGGRFLPDGAPGTAARDSYEAIWEHVFGRSIVYPDQRYAEPVLIRPAAFRWIDSGPGVARRNLGSFTERGLRLWFVRLEPGATITLGEAGAVTLAFVVSGTGDAAGTPWRPRAGLRLAAGETADLTATGHAEIFLVTLPLLETSGVV
jgi:quercetin dioxygenase-like cupin family protein